MTARRLPVASPTGTARGAQRSAGRWSPVLRPEVAVRPDEQHVSAPRLGQLAVLTACVDAMRDLPIAQNARGSDPSLATTRNPVSGGLNGLKAARRFWVYERSGRIRHGSTRRDRDPHFNSAPLGSVIFCRGVRQSDRGVL